jgi:predicted Fe-Mo cluster-binding NifX family protein
MCVAKRQGKTKRSKSIGQCEGDVMKIAITSIDGTLEGMVDERFGRAKKLVVYDTGADTFEVAENSKQMNLAQGAGIQAAQNVVNLGVRVIISGHIGPKAFQVLKSANIDTYSAVNMTVADAIRQYKDGSLGRLAGADVQGHW